MELGAVIDGRFEIIKMLGNGGYGEVAVVKDSEANDEKALKMIPKINSNGSPDFSHRLELNALRGLHGTPGVPELFSFGELETHRWFVMTKFTENLERLRQKIPTKAFQPKTVLQILWQLIKVLQSIHENGFLHQDLKLPNIMVSASDHTAKIVIVDFGLARPFQQGIIADTEVKVQFRNSLAPPRAFQKQPYLESEELFVVGLLTLILRDERRWLSNDREKLLQTKIRLAENPGIYMKEEDAPLVPVVKALTNQIYGEVPQYHDILKIINNGLCAFNSPRDLHVTYINGELYIE